jgi:hypothetical protein
MGSPNALVLHHQADVRRWRVESDQRPCLCLDTMCDAFSNKSAADGRRTVKYRAGSPVADGGPQSRSRPIVVTPRPFDPTVEENFGNDQGRVRYCALFGESDLIAV